MIDRKTYENAVQRTLAAFELAHIALTDEEKGRVEVADFGLNDLEQIGLQLVIYINTERVCSKEMVLFPHQTCPEHRHPDLIGADGAKVRGKQETFRCRAGEVELFVSGERNVGDIALPPTDVTVFHRVLLRPGEQYTLYPDTLHWFRAGAEGAVVSEFSTMSRDETDIFTDPRIVRTPEVGA